MKTKAAVLREPGGDWEVAELELDPPKDREVQIRMVSAGLCHSDEHVRSGGSTVRCPIVGGHEGGGVVEAVGPGVTRVEEGDHIVFSYIPSCGHCRWCVTGYTALCDLGATITVGHMLDGTYRFHDGSEDVGALCLIGTFAERTVVPETSVVKISKEYPLDVAGLVSCGVPTGFGSATKMAGTVPGDTVVVFGTGGVGMNAVQGAAAAGADNVIAVDPVDFKRSVAPDFGATHVAADAEAAIALAKELTNGVGADSAVVTIGVVEAPHVQAAFEAIRKQGTLVLTGTSGSTAGNTVQLHGSTLTLWQKRVQGTIFGGLNPHADIPRLLEVYKKGGLKLDELVTSRYKLEDINEGYHDLHEGKNLRGIIDFSL
jgi:NDMA-dependent alcohol dehydrogenase